jgi:signal peptidase I
VTVVHTKKLPSRRRSNNSFWRELPILLGAAIVVAILVRTFVLQTYYVPSASMEHTLNINDRVLVNKLAYDFRDPHRGEVIVFNSPESWREAPNQTVFVKRVIGIPGDHIICCDANGLMTINGKVIDGSSFLDLDGNKNQAPHPFDITVPAGRLWVMGDHRYDSADSLENYGNSANNIDAATIPIKSVIGRAFVLFWPFSRATWLTVPDAFDNIPSPGMAPPG